MQFSELLKAQVPIAGGDDAVDVTALMHVCDLLAAQVRVLPAGRCSVVHCQQTCMHADALYVGGWRDAVAVIAVL